MSPHILPVEGGKAAYSHWFSVRQFSEALNKVQQEQFDRLNIIV